MDQPELLATAIQTAILAGEKILQVYHSDNFDIQIKSDQSPLTLADQQSNEIILLGLKNTGIPVLSEESLHAPYETRKNWDRCWIVDPLDGTKEFIQRNGEFTVNIALVVHGEPVMGVILTPVTGELYFGSPSTGSHKYLIPGHVGTGVSLDSIFQHSQLLPINNGTKEGFTVVASRSHRNAETDDFIRELELEFGPMRVLSRGSSLKICMVAEGTADFYPRFAPTMEWDTAAGHAIARFADCSMKNPVTSSELIYNKEILLNPWFIVKRAK